jgi:ABC-type transport system involved in cytochrome bd biosynthesis fused ATPase/permease subunit
VLLARALIKKSPLFILDEPTANVDLQTEKTIEAVIGDLTATNDTAVIAITHAADFGKKARELHIENGRLHE